METVDFPSPNFGERRGCGEPRLAVIHYTAMDSDRAALERLSDPEFEVSCHYLIGGGGRVFRMVDEGKRAWHAGRGLWGGLGDVNSRSIGIELANDGRTPFEAAQMLSLESLLIGIMSRWPIAPEGVIAHSDLAVGRKADPGPKFDWRRLALEGLSIWPDAGARAKASRSRFIEAAERFGYGLPEDRGRDPFDFLLAAFRLRFRPWASGPLGEEDAGAIESLAERWPFRTGGV